MNLFFSYVWEFPQNIIALIYFFYMLVKGEFSHIHYNKKKHLIIIILAIDFMPISLGRFIFYPDYKIADYWMDRAEIESKHSQLLGPLYLIVFRIPKYIWCTVNRYFSEQ